MNTNQYTQKTLEALQAAQQLAVEYQHNQLEPEHLLRALSSTRILLAAVPTATSCFRHWRRSLLLQAIPSPALLPCGNRVPPQRTVLRETPDPLTVADSFEWENYDLQTFYEPY